MDESQNSYAEWNKPKEQKYILHDSIYIKVKKIQVHPWWEISSYLEIRNQERLRERKFYKVPRETWEMDIFPVLVADFKYVQFIICQLSQ